MSDRLKPRCHTRTTWAARRLYAGAVGRVQHDDLKGNLTSGSNSPMKAPVKPRVYHLPCVRVVPLLYLRTEPGHSPIGARSWCPAHTMI
jgi:hypothetical protein